MPQGDRGRFTKGNRAALIHGRYSRQVAEAALPEQAEARAHLAARRAALVDHCGGSNAVKDAIIARFVEVCLVADWLAANLATHGVLTSKGKQRAAVSAYLSVTDRVMRLASMLGLDPTPRDVGESVHEYLARTRGADPSTAEGKEDRP